MDMIFRNLTIRGAFPLACLIAAFSSTGPSFQPALALTFEEGQTFKARLSPFGRLTKMTTTGSGQSLNLTTRGLGHFETTATILRRSLERAGLNPLLQLRKQPQATGQTFNLTGTAQTTSERFDYYLNGTRFCRHEIGVHQVGSASMMSGTFPAANGSRVPYPDDWASEEDALAAVASSLEGSYGELEAVVRSERCLWVGPDGEVLPVWQFMVRAAGLPFLVVAGGDDVIDIEKHYFSAVGKSKVFDSNATNGAFAFAALGNLKGDGTLESDIFVVDTGGVDKAQSCQHLFLYEPTDDEFNEASVFTHTTRTLDWYSKSFAYEWTAPQMEIKINQLVNGTQNNALYQPGEAFPDNAPRIFIGTGDGKGLQNLLTDADVVSHEFGHHIVYRRVKTTRDDSLVIHEGLADYFTFARTGDGCLGESICPAGSAFCFLPEQCLRSAETDLSFKSQIFSQLPPHQKSQALSGMLWDLSREHSVPIAAARTIVYNAIDLLSSTTTYQEFLLALLIVDQGQFAKAHCAKIELAATARGLEDFLPADLDCPSPSSTVGTTLVSALTTTAQAEVDESQILLAIATDEASVADVAATDACAVEPPAAAAPPSSSKKNKDELIPGCGRVPGPTPTTPHGTRWAVWALILLPLAAGAALTRLRTAKHKYISNKYE